MLNAEMMELETERNKKKDIVSRICELETSSLPHSNHQAGGYKCLWLKEQLEEAKQKKWKFQNFPRDA